eukprot:jgi/Chlat1/2759/Chrsp187S02939
MGGMSRAIGYICRPIGVSVGFVYPSYASYKALEAKTPEASAQWLTYWVVFSLFIVVEYIADYLFASWLPFAAVYYVAKLGFIIWLQLPQTQGANVLYVKAIQPLIKRHEAKIDQTLEQGRMTAESNFFHIRSRITGSGVVNRHSPSDHASFGGRVVVSAADEAASSSTGGGGPPGRVKGKDFNDTL